ncbi:restriction endonuclease subunit S [Virgibacillus halophilus]|uniref:Restriction endonuclease subunit S n=1 Tax=Tigheibacillus halophilus TaxID=361280 RepID=A0ABU5C6H3_9BACI|nr:restriction endonuclease subunit S [Virgibacillus halophilus]
MNYFYSNNKKTELRSKSRTHSHLHSSVYIPKQGSVVKPKDILLNITGGSIGRCALVPDDFDVANVNQHVMIVRNLISENRFLLHYILVSSYIQSMIMSVQVGVSREGLSAEKLKKVFNSPPTSGRTKAYRCKN